MKYFVEETEEGQKAYGVLQLNHRMLNVLNSDLAIKILQEISKRPSCAMDIARRLKQHEQKVYYHLRRLEAAGIIKLLRREERVGATAKIYEVTHSYLAVKLFDGEHLTDVKTKARELDFFKPFIENGRLDATIIVGSPEPHGKYSAQASDGYGAIDLALYIGSFLDKSSPNYKLDTEVRDKDLEGNLIIIGGPKANIIIDKVNKDLPIYFDTNHDFNIVSSITKSTYAGDEVGIVVKMKSPFVKKSAKNEKYILVISGKRFRGTRAAILAIVKRMKELQKGNNVDGGIARVVRGIDKDADGAVDDVEFLE
jgi:DNA-binding PadR family transcriptional regulator